MKGEFDVSSFRTFLEKALGFAFSEFEQLKCVNSFNFRAVRATDGFRFLVKCTFREDQDKYQRLLRQIPLLDGAKVPRRLFAETCPTDFQGYGVVCFSWVEGGKKFPDQLTAAEFDAFLDDYQRFIHDLQKLPREVPPCPIETLRKDDIGGCVRFGQGLQWLKRKLAEIPPEECCYQENLLQVIHGDLHFGNFYFTKGRVSGFFDYEGRLGYPTMDLIRYIVYAYDRVPWFERPWRQRHILARFARMVEYLPYSKKEWLVAVNWNRLDRIAKKFSAGNPSLLRIFRIWLNERFYARLRKLVQHVDKARPEVEKALGFGLSEFRRLKGGSSPNFKAVRASDGFPFLVKLLPPGRQDVYSTLVAHLEEMRGTKAVQRVFSEAAEDVGEFKLICLEWCEGVSRSPNQLTEAELRAFLAEYDKLLARLQLTTHVDRPYDAFRWREKLMRCPGLWVRALQAVIRREAPLAEIAYQSERLKTIFGDFHPGNVFFKDDKVSRFVDLESFALGYPTDDLVRYFICAFEHLSLGGLGARKRILAAFRKVVTWTHYSLDEWILSIDAALIRKFDGYDGDYGFFRVLRLLARVRFYLDLKRIVRENLV